MATKYYYSVLWFPFSRYANRMPGKILTQNGARYVTCIRTILHSCIVVHSCIVMHHIKWIETKQADIFSTQKRIKHEESEKLFDSVMNSA